MQRIEAPSRGTKHAKNWDAKADKDGGGMFPFPDDLDSGTSASGVRPQPRPQKHFGEFLVV